MLPFRPPHDSGIPPRGYIPSGVFTPVSANPTMMAVRGPPTRGPPSLMFPPGRAPPPSMAMGIPSVSMAHRPPHHMAMGDPGSRSLPPSPPHPGMNNAIAPSIALAETGPLNVFVGKLPTDLNDSYVRNLLEKCGHVVSWKRTVDPVTNKPKAFGYCTYASAMDVLRALRLLNGFLLDSKRILVKVDTKTQAKLDEFASAMSDTMETEEQAHDQELQQVLKNLEDERSGFMGGIQNHPASWGDLLGGHSGTTDERVAGLQETASSDGPSEVAAPVETRVQQKMILKEVEKFRLAQDQRAQELEQKRRDALRERLHREERNVERLEAATESQTPESEPTKADTDAGHEPMAQETNVSAPGQMRSLTESNRNEDDANGTRISTARGRKREQECERDRTSRDHDRTVRDRDRDRGLKKNRGKRTRSHSRSRSRSRERSRRRRRRSSRTRSRSRSQSRRHSQSRSRSRDRDRERHHRRRRHSSAVEDDLDDGHRRKRRKDSKSEIEATEATTAPVAVEPEVAKPTPAKVVMELKMPLGGPKKHKPAPQPTASLFKVDEEVDDKPVRELVRIDFDAEEKVATALAQERAAAAAIKINRRSDDVKTLIDRIPTTTTELFGYPIDWVAVDAHGIVKTKMATWVTKKVLEYVGEEDATMIRFILTKLQAHATAHVILEELQAILEDEAEVFVKLLWRKLAFEALRAGV